MTNKNSTKSFANTLAIYGKFTLKYKVFLAITIVLLPPAVIGSNILLPLVYSEAINTVQTMVGTNQNVWQVFGKLIWFTLAIISFVWASWRAIGFAAATLLFRVKRDLEQYIFRHLTNHSYSFHTSSFSGSLVAQTNRMTTSYERLFDTLLFNISRMIVLAVAVLIVIFTKSAILGFIILSWIIVYCCIMAFLQFKKLPLAKNAAAEDSKVTASLADSLTNIFAIITFGHKNNERKNFNKVSQKRYKTAIKDWYVTEVIFAIQTFLITTVEALVIWVTIDQTLKGNLGIGDIVLVQFYIISLLSYFWDFGRILRNIERSLADASEMTEILNQTESVKDPKIPEKLEMNAGKIEFIDVSFSYDAKGRLFYDLNLNIEPGEKIGLVGPSGGGKTTITKLLLRLMDIDSGIITIDDQAIDNVKQDELRQNIAYVPQEPVLFHRTIAENIRYGDPDASFEQIQQAAKLAKADDFISELSNGYDTLVGERGVKLSGGQKQRIAIARALLKKAPLLLLDEATSALDSESESAIQEALWRLMENRTAIVIAHRLSTIQKMDRIIVIDKGKIIEQGGHQELLKKNGEYAKLWKHQSGGFISD